MSDQSNKRLLVVQVAGLGWDLAQDVASDGIMGRAWIPMETVFPAVTSTVQASFRTGVLPAEHGIVANGWMDRSLRRTFFWEQSAALVQGERIWSDFRESDKRVAMLYWQQSLGEFVDTLLSPAPIHRHHGGMIDATYAIPGGLYEKLAERVGRDFALRNYWGPLASVRSSEWIAEATAALLKEDAYAPDLCLTYLPGLDYDLQRYGPDHPRSADSVRSVRQHLAKLLQAAEDREYDWLVFGDYAIVKAEKPVFINRRLRDAGWMATREVNGRFYPDPYTSRAFAVVDHEVAHIYLQSNGDKDTVRSLLLDSDGVEDVLDPRKDIRALDHPRSGDLIAVANDGAWFAYDWWDKRSEAPDYAGHVDIHNKPGFDPGELFWGWPPGRTSIDATKIGGTHGKNGKDRRVAIAASYDTGSPKTLLDLSKAVGEWLQRFAR